MKKFKFNADNIILIITYISILVTGIMFKQKKIFENNRFGVPAEIMQIIWSIE